MLITPWMRAYRKSWLKRKLGKSAKVSAHFTHYEFWTKDGTPIPIKAVPALKIHCKTFLEPMRARFGPCHATSGYRHESYNRKIKGASDSRHDWDKHPTAVATDVSFATGTPVEWGEYARELRARANGGRGGIGVYTRSGFIHIDSRNYRADWHGN